MYIVQVYSSIHPFIFSVDLLENICEDIFMFPGPRLFLACPMDVSNAQVWFTDLWNYSIVPYLLEAVREGIQVASNKLMK